MYLVIHYDYAMLHCQWICCYWYQNYLSGAAIFEDLNHWNLKSESFSKKKKSNEIIFMDFWRFAEDFIWNIMLGTISIILKILYIL